MGDAYPRAPQRRSDYEDGAAGLAPRTRLFVTRSPVGGNKIARIATRGLFNLIRGPRVVWLGEPMLDVVRPANLVEAVDAVQGSRAATVLGQLGELDAVIGQDDVQAVRTSLDERLQKGAGHGPISAFVQLGEGVFGCPVDGHPEVQLAFAGANFRDVDMKEANRISLEGLLTGLVAADLG